MAPTDVPHDSEHSIGKLSSAAVLLPPPPPPLSSPAELPLAQITPNGVAPAGQAQALLPPALAAFLAVWREAGSVNVLAIGGLTPALGVSPD